MIRLHAWRLLGPYDKAWLKHCRLLIWIRAFEEAMLVRVHQEATGSAKFGPN